MQRRQPPWGVLFGVLALSVLVLLVYGRSLKWPVLVWGLLLVAIASATVGGLIGFLFGIPRGRREATAAVASDGKAGATGTVTLAIAGDAQGAAANSDGARNQVGYEPSNSLEQVADWLTKILIGVGLVELRDIGGAVSRLGDQVSTSFGGATGAAVVTQAIVIAFAALGFLGGFLWTRLYYGGIQTMADVEILDLLHGVERKASRADQVSRALAKGELRGVGATPSLTGDTGLESTERITTEWPPDLRAKVEQFRAEPRMWDSDPVARLFRRVPAKSDTRRLVAEVVTAYPSELVLRLRVESTDGTVLEGPVTFLLHPTFAERVQVALPDGRAATLQVLAQGSFTAAAIADGGRTVLALDLSTLPDVPQWFKDT